MGHGSEEFEGFALVLTDQWDDPSQVLLGGPVLPFHSLVAQPLVGEEGEWLADTF
jgi:hypothetical protein